ncbi:MAG: PAS domain S-box protein [Candidatus Polarisedimenticolaceae bacterium]|nr:PAS domain S-box protein [Candidatus Polarisedimenticolaceae bacterium]
MPITSPPPPMSHLGLLRGFLAIFAPLAVLLILASLMHYYTLYETDRVSREANEELNVSLAKRMIVTDISSVARDLAFLARHIEKQGLFKISTAERHQRISLEFSAFAEKKALYDQIRFLDTNGMENVRINYVDGKAQEVTGSALQNKSNRYYFREAFSLGRDKIYLSPLDLNIEDNRIEQPLKPVMRFATPLFDLSGRKQGVVVLNYFGQRLIENFTYAAANIVDHIALTNSQGYWLSSPNSEDEWGFMLGNNKSMPTRYPAAWQRIAKEHSGQFENNNGLFTFATIKPTQVALETSDPLATDNDALIGTDSFWKIISRVTPEALTTTLPAFIRVHAALYSIMLVLILAGSWILALTRQKHRLAEAQSEYEQRFRHTLENIELVAVALDRRGTVRFCNDYFLKLTSWNLDEVVNHQWLEKFVPDKAKDDAEQMLASMASPENFPTQFETPILTKDGQQRLINWNSTLSYDAQNRVIGITGIGEDITDKRHTEEQLRKLSQAVEQSPSTVMITNVNGAIEYVNPKFIEVTGYQADEVIGCNPSILKSGEKSTSEYANLWHTVNAGKEWRGEFHNRKKNGELFWESASISGIRGPDGEISHFLAVKEDITERKRLEQKVEAHHRELAKSEALAAMGRMASMIAHDLRNPLSSVKMTLQILSKQKNDRDSAKADELRAISLEQIRYMEEILSDMLTYSRPDALKPEWLTIDKVMDMAVGLIQRKFDELGVDLTTHYQPGLPTLHGDATKLRQIFSNLLINAAQATENCARAEVSIDVMLELGPTGTGIRIDICDNGCGIVPEDRERLFEPFFTTRAQGTGLGLAIVKRMVEQHHGTIEMLANKTGGTCASIVLPTTPQTANEPDNQAMEIHPL